MRNINKGAAALLLTGLLVLGGCTDEEKGGESASEIVSAVESPSETTTQPFAALQEVQKITLKGDAVYTLSSQGEEWVSPEIIDLDQSSVWKLVQEFVALRGTGEEKEKLALEEEPLLELEVVDGENTAWKATFFRDHSGSFYMEYGENQEWMRLSSLPAEFENFIPTYLEPSINYHLGKLEEIIFRQGKEQFRINQSTAFSKVETAPFVSGWFLHDAFETEFSLEYSKAEALLTHILNLKGRKLERQDQMEKEEVSFEVELRDGTNAKTLQFGKKEGDYILLYLNNSGDWYEVPALLASSLAQDPFSLIDNFIALIPLDAVTSAEIHGPEETFLLEAEHELTTDKSGNPAITSKFLLNGKEQDEDSFRRTYQYLAALQYAAASVEEKPEQEAEVTIRYVFQSEGKEEKREIQFYPLDEEEYLVEKDGIHEFTAKQADVKTMLEEFGKLE